MCAPPTLACLRGQVRWVQFRHCWVTAADDDTIRLWSPDGHKLHQFTYTGSSVQVGAETARHTPPWGAGGGHRCVCMAVRVV